MEKYSFNQSQRNIWMNEKAYPGKSINTIGIRMHFPEHSAEAVCEAVNYIIHQADIFYVEVAAEEQFEKKEQPISRCITGPKLSYDGAEDEAAFREQQPFQTCLYDALVWPLLEGGALLSFCFHHLIIDGFGMCLIARQILNVLEHKPVELPDFFSAANETKAPDDRLEKEFWHTYMKGLHAKAGVFDKEINKLSQSSYWYHLPESLETALEAFAEKHQVTVPAVFGAALSIYLSRATQCSDAVFQMPRLNRENPSLRKIAGCFTLVVPVRVTVDEQESFAMLCRQASAQARQASQHKHYDYHRLLADLRQQELIEQEYSQYTLNYYSPQLESSIPHTLEISVSGNMHNHLTMNVFHFNNSYEIRYDVQHEIYNSEKAEFFHRALLSIMEKGITHNAAAAECEIISHAEKEKLLVELKGKELPFDSDETIPGLFRKAVRQYGARKALYAGADSYTYTGLELASNQAANALLERGIEPGDFVMFLLYRDKRLLPVILGILKAGAVFVPVDPAYPKGRIEYMMDNCKARLLIADPLIPGIDQYEFEPVDSLFASEDTQEPAVELHQEQAAYCIYTSGTTGKPKGTVISHRGIVNITRPDNNPFNKDICKCGKGIAAIGSICFDISLFEIFVPLLNGMFVELVPDRALADPKELAGYIQAHGANLLHCTPSRLSVYLNHPDFAKAAGGLEVLLSAGEVLPRALTERIRDDYGIRIYNGYGPTEATIGATITEAYDMTTIGRPIANTGILVIDRKGRLLPFGAPGELAIYGSGVGIGYFGMEELSAERFCRIEDRRVYRSGDLGYYQEDGRIIFQGRNDQQIKLRGLRIEPAEIENCMLGYEGIAQACVMVRRINENEHLVGFYTHRADTLMDEETFRGYLKEQLALYMVPDILQSLEELPQTAGGKTDYRALEAIPIDYTRCYRQPQTAAEQAICEAFELVLEQKPVGLDDHFFELGGTSLDVARLIVEIEDRLSNIDLDYGDLFKYPTPALLAGHFGDSGGQSGSRNLLPPLDYSAFGSGFLDSGEAAQTASLGRVLLTGATGYLGIHLLAELLRQPELTEHIYCIVRQKGKMTAAKRVKTSLFYYHDFDFGENFSKKVTVLEGDLTNMEWLSEELKLEVDTVIHSAANVAHFAYGDTLEKINTESVRQLLRFCRKQSAQFIHISTISVGGVYPLAPRVQHSALNPASSEHAQMPLTLTEQDLYIGQEIHSAYVLSKYMAEYEVLRWASREGLPVKIMRVGNLQGRISDGEFQMNIRENAFARQLSGYVKLGKVPASLYHSYVNFSPVDEVARMILLLSRADDSKRIFHVYPEDEIQYASLFAEIEKCGHPTAVVSDEEFHQWTDAIRRNKEGRLLMEKIFIDKADLDYAPAAIDHTLTLQLLSQWGERWATMTEHYFRRYIEVLDGMMLFDK